MLFTTASNSSPAIYYATLALLILTPIILFAIGFFSTRSKDKNTQRAGYAFLKIAGVVTLLVLVAFWYMARIGALSGPGFNDPNVMGGTTTTTAVAETTKALIAAWF